MKLFQNRAFQVKLVSTTDNPQDVQLIPNINISKDDVIDVTDNLIEKSAIAVIAVIAAAALARTASDIIVHRATRK